MSGSGNPYCVVAAAFGTINNLTGFFVFNLPANNYFSLFLLGIENVVRWVAKLQSIADLWVVVVVGF